MVHWVGLQCMCGCGIFCPYSLYEHFSLFHHSILQVYKILNQIDRVHIDKFFNMSDLLTRGSSLKIFKPRSQLKVRSSVLSNRVVDVWNSLANSVVTASSLNSFKSRLNKHWHGHELKFNASCYIPGETVFSNFVRSFPKGL